MANRWNMKTGTDFLFLGSKITAGGDCSHNIKIRFLLGMIMTNLWSESCSVVSNSLQPHGLCSPWNSQGQNTGVVAFPFSRGSSQPRQWTGVSQPRSPTLQADSLPAEPQGKPKNTGVGSLSLLQQIFPTQDSNWGLLHCRWILYQPSYQGSPAKDISVH